MYMNELPISPYGTCFVLSFLVSFAVVVRLLKKRHLPGQIILYSVLINLLLTLFGAKLYAQILTGFTTPIWEAGTASLGGAVGLLCGIALFNLLYPGHVADFFTSYICVLPLLYSISKIGCHLAGCCHGIAYHGLFSISYNNQVLKTDGVFPVQITESIVFFLFFLGLMLYARYVKPSDLSLISLTLLLCSLGKFSLEFIRAEHVGVLISSNQIICILFFIIAIFLLAKNNRIHSAD